MENEKDKRILACIISIGLVLYVIHTKNQPLIDYIFLPHIGAILIILPVYILLSRYYKQITLGPKCVWVPMVVIVVSMIARMCVGFSYQSLGGALFGLVLFALYIASRIIGKQVFDVIIISNIILAVSVIVYGLIYPGEPSGGLMTGRALEFGRTANFNMVKTFIMFGAAVSVFRYRWYAVTLSLIALYFAGNIEAIIGVCFLGLVLIAKWDYSKKLIITGFILAIIVLGWTIAGPGIELHEFTVYKLKAGYSLISGGNHLILPEKTLPKKLDNLSTGRLVDIKKAVDNIKPTGHGYYITTINEFTVHNVPLLIMDQIGPLAAIAWMFLVVYGMFRTRWKYAWMVVIACSTISHEFWTQAAPYVWVLAGVSSLRDINNDNVFKEE